MAKRRRKPITPKKECGCYADYIETRVAEECVIDSGTLEECSLAKSGMKKEDCKYWRAK
jgi:hypothetical protein